MQFVNWEKSNSKPFGMRLIITIISELCAWSFSFDSYIYAYSVPSLHAELVCCSLLLLCDPSGLRTWIFEMLDNVHYNNSQCPFPAVATKTGTKPKENQKRIKRREGNSPGPFDSGRVRPGPPGLIWVKFCTISFGRISVNFHVCLAHTICDSLVLVVCLSDVCGQSQHMYVCRQFQLSKVGLDQSE